MFGGSPIYSPLPQSNSESDEFSEEELHALTQRQGVITTLGLHGKPPGPENVLNTKNPDLINCKECDDAKDMGLTSTAFQIGGDEVPLFTTNDNNNNLSPARKLCFSFSIFWCVFTTVFFLWILPCEIDPCQQATAVSTKNTLFNVELFGPVSIVFGGRRYNKIGNMVFLFRKSFFGEKDDIVNGKLAGGTGVVSVLSGSKEASWWTFLDKEPRDVDCNVIDVNLDGMNDCLVVGKDNLLISIESSSGKKLWEFNGDQGFALKKCNFEFPIVLPDFDGDDVKDLLGVCSVDSASGDLVPNTLVYFILVSGRRGVRIGKPAEITNCYSVLNVTLEKDFVISYNCFNLTNTESFEKLSLWELLLNTNGSALEKLKVDKRYSGVVQHKIKPDDNFLSLDGRRLIVENQGECPEKCKMIVRIEDERNEKNSQSLCSMSINNSYGMIPVGLQREKFTTFVFKFWHWKSYEKDEVDVEEKMDENNEEEGDKVSPRSMTLEESKSLEYAMFEGDVQASERFKRTLRKRVSDEVGIVDVNILKTENLTFHRIVEKIVVITFNETNVPVINTSQCDIVQICGKRGTCQPDSRLQRQSLHMADINNDKFEELISYSSSFTNQLDEESSVEVGAWQLQSDVKVVKLEHELAKVYEDKN